MSSEVYKRIGARTASRVATVLFTVPSNKRMVISSINVCNKHNSSLTIRIAHVDGGKAGALAAEDYIVFEESIPANKSVGYARGITASWDDSIVVSASTTGNTASVVFIAWGSVRK